MGWRHDGGLSVLLPPLTSHVNGKVSRVVFLASRASKNEPQNSKQTMFSYPKSGMFRLLALPILVEAAGPVVQTPLGEVQGITTAFGGRGFLGLPFAEPPVGEYRFKPARKKQPWSGTLDATKFKPACLQTAVVPGLTQDESCLFLQVFTPPHANSGSNLPVYFWIHGGSFLFGRSF